MKNVRNTMNEIRTQVISFFKRHSGMKLFHAKRKLYQLKFPTKILNA